MFNTTFSTYDSLSLINKINNAAKNRVCIYDDKKIFYNTVELSKQVFEATHGYFDPTVMPLVKYWGFGPKKEQIAVVDKTKIDSILQLLD